MAATYRARPATVQRWRRRRGDWGGYWGKQGPQLLAHRSTLYAAEQRMVLGANTFRLFMDLLAAIATGDAVEVVAQLKEESDVGDRRRARLRRGSRLRPRAPGTRTLDGRTQELTYRPTLH